MALNRKIAIVNLSTGDIDIKPIKAVIHWGPTTR